jgi:hypothetical protein
LIANERWAVLAEYAPIVTLVAIIGAYSCPQAACSLSAGFRVRHCGQQ